MRGFAPPFLELNPRGRAEVRHLVRVERVITCSQKSVRPLGSDEGEFMLSLSLLSSGKAKK